MKRTKDELMIALNTVKLADELLDLLASVPHKDNPFIDDEVIVRDIKQTMLNLLESEGEKKW